MKTSLVFPSLTLALLFAIQFNCDKSYADGYLTDGVNWHPVASCEVRNGNSIDAISCLDKKTKCGPYSTNEYDCTSAASSCTGKALFKEEIAKGEKYSGNISYKFGSKTLVFTNTDKKYTESSEKNSNIIAISPPYLTNLEKVFPKNVLTQVSSQVFLSADGCPPHKNTTSSNMEIPK